MEMKNQKLECNSCIAGCSSECQIPGYITNKKYSKNLECFCKDKCARKFPIKNQKYLKGGKNADR